MTGFNDVVRKGPTRQSDAPLEGQFQNSSKGPSLSME